MGALQVGYGVTTRGRYQGPFPERVDLAGNGRVRVRFDTALQFRDMTARGFEVSALNMVGGSRRAGSGSRSGSVRVSVSQGQGQSGSLITQGQGVASRSVRATLGGPAQANKALNA